MSLFKKKKPSAQDTAKPQSAPKTKKKKDSMASVLSESVTDRVMEDFRENEGFIGEQDGETVYVGLLLDTADIGGLNKKSKKDEDKGSLIQVIENNKINAYIPSELMEEEKIVFIPNLTTLSTMDEYSLLINAPYTIALIHEDGTVDDTAESIRFDEVKSYAENLSSDTPSAEELEDFMEEHGVLLDGSEARAMEEADEDVEFPPEPDDEIVETEPVQMENPFAPAADEEEYPEVMSDFQPEQALNQLMDFSDGDDDENLMDYDFSEPEKAISSQPEENLESQDNPDLYEGDYEEEIITPDEVAQTMRKVFYKDDLDIEVSYDDFENMFGVNNAPTLFNQLDTGWLNDQVNVLINQANGQLQIMHENNIRMLKDRFYSLMASQAEHIQRELDPENEGTKIYSLKQAILQAEKQARQEMTEISRSRRMKLREEWEKRLDEVADEAQAAARANYKRRHQTEYEDRLEKIDTDLENEIHAKKAEALLDLNQYRRQEAAKNMQYGSIEIMKKLSEINRVSMENERKVYEEWAAEIQEYMNNWRTEEQNVLRALEVDNEKNRKVEEITDEMNQKLQQDREHFEQAKAEWNEKYNAQLKMFEDRIQLSDAAWKEKIERQETMYGRLQDDYNDLKNRYDTLDEKKEARYKSRVRDLERDKKRLRKELKDVKSQGEKHNRTFTAMMVAIGISMLIVGILVGVFIQSNQNSAYDRQLEELDRQLRQTETE